MTCFQQEVVTYSQLQISGGGGGKGQRVGL